MGNEKYYYQILIITSSKHEDLVYWVRNEKINYSTNNELVGYIRKNLPIIKNYKKIINVMAMEVPKEVLDTLNAHCEKYSEKKDFIVINDK